MSEGRSQEPTGGDAPAPTARGFLADTVRKLVIIRTNQLYVQALRSLLVGGVAAVADFGTYLFTVRVLGIHYLIGNASGLVTGVVVNYLLSIWWVFPVRRFRSKTIEFLVFGGIGIAGLGISEACMYVGVGLFGLYDLLVKVGATVVTFGWNFGVRRALLFRGDRQE